MIPYARQSIDDDDVAAVIATLRSDRLTQGPRVEEFEEALAAAVEARYAVAFSSGTAALHGAMYASDVGAGDTVATSALTFVASANCARYVGALPVLVDIDSTTLNLDVERVPVCSALVAVHFAGLPVDLERLVRRPRVVIEDAAHALGARTPDGPVGSCARSEMCTFSFHAVKAVTTGEGGAVTTNSPMLAERLRRFRSHGCVRPTEREAWYYEATEVGFNYRLTDIQSALGVSQLAKLERFVARRRDLAARYRAALADTTVVLPPEAPTGWRHAYHLFPVRVANRGAVHDDLRSRGIGVQVHYVPLSRHPVLGSHAPGAYPETERAYAALLSLPLFPDLSEELQDDVVVALLDALGEPQANGASGPIPAQAGPAPRSLSRSIGWWERARAVIPMGTQTLSKGPTQYVQGASPIYLARGRGPHVWDVDGNRYLDFPMALGAVILGYAEPCVDEAIRRQLDRGITFTLMHELEVEVAERIVGLCPGVEAVRFGKSGSDALTAAVRAARAVTGRDVVLVGGYHGWHDWYVGGTTRAAGVPEAVRGLVARFAFNDTDDLERALDAHDGRVAAVVLEPSGAETPTQGFLRAVVDLARRRGAISVFDEVITGFRLAPGGARERYGVEPDISCYGKALGNGMPISAVAGSWDVMRAFEEVFFSTTHGGETLSLAAARAVLAAIAEEGVLTEIEARGRRMLGGIAALIDSHGVAGRVRVGGEPHRAVVEFGGTQSLVDRSWVQQALVERGILFNGSMFLCRRHHDAHVDEALEALDGAFAMLAKHESVGHLLVGDPVQPVFRE